VNKFDRIFRKIVSVPAVIAGCFLIVMMMVVVVDVFLRALFSTAILGSNEISTAVMIVAGFLGISWCALNDNHIKVELIVEKLPIHVQRYFHKFNWLVVSVMSFFISIYSYTSAQGVKRLNSQSELLGIPHYPQYLVVSFSYMLLCLTTLILFIRSFAKSKGDKQENTPVKAE
jgi:TRAP-type C4-dicarboxylate transport system permease small subunit